MHMIAMSSYDKTDMAINQSSNSNTNCDSDKNSNDILTVMFNQSDLETDYKC